MPLPNFLIIGAAKAGTTSLYDWLRQHPDVFMPSLKEPKFFAYDPARTDIQFPVRTLADYAALFEGATERAIGEASPNYLGSSPAMHRIHATLPGVRLIAALRDPADRAFSVYQMNLRNRGRNRATPFAEALRDDVNLRQGYARYLERWFALFDRAQVRIVLFEEIAQAPLATVQGLFGFLGVDPAFAPVTSVSNPGGLPKVKLVHDLLTSETVRGLGRHLPETLVARARGLRARNLRKQGMTPDERRAAAAFFRDDVLRTQDLIGRDLSAWLRA
jgi:sulfotransferase family protein